MEAALDLVAVVAAAAAQPHAALDRNDSPAGAAAGPASEPFVWRQPIMRPAVTAKQVCICDYAGPHVALRTALLTGTSTRALLLLGISHRGTQSF